MEAGQPERLSQKPSESSGAEGADQRLQQALAVAYRHLNRRDRTVVEMRLHLERRGCRAAEIESTLELLEQQGYLDDARFARLFVEDKRTLELWGSERIHRTLKRRGIDAELVDQVLAAQAPHGEITRALALLRRRFPIPPRERRERDRALGVLIRKGYDSEVALEALVAYADCADSPPVLRCR